MSKKNMIILFLIAPLFALMLACAKIYHSIEISSYSGPDKEFLIQSGEGFSRINYRLHKKGLIKSSKLFHRYSQFNGLMTKFKAGKYIIKTNSNMLDVIETLTNGKGLTISVTIPEGKNLFEIANILQRKKILRAKDFIRLAKNVNFVTDFGIHADRIEGYLYPETYNFVENTPAKQVLKTMVGEFKKRIKILDFSKSKMSKHSIITLASVVEKETGASFERPRIAGVFLNRLKKKMRLQSDPTTIYGIYEIYNGNLRKKHLRQKTPYNTYKIPGLPKGPISNPGLESIRAVLNPEKHSYLYFVSKNDGTHIFSKTYKQHILAVNEFQKKAKNRRGKSWRNLKQK